MTLELHVRKWDGPNELSMGSILTLLNQGYQIRILENGSYRGKFIKSDNRWGYLFLKGKEI